MDSNNRVEQLESDLKLLKNEIKQVLLEIQEHVLNAQNPFTITASGFAAGQKRDAPEHVVSTQPAISTLAVDAVERPGTAEETPPASPVASTPVPGQESAAGPRAEQYRPAPAPPASEAPAQQESYISGPQAPRHGGAAHASSAEPDPYRTAQAGPSLGGGRATGQGDGGHQPGQQPFVVGASMGPGIQFRHHPSRSQEGQPGPEHAEADYSPVGEAGGSRESRPDVERAEASARPADKAPRGAARKRDGFDLVTIAGLAQWTDKVLRRVGRTNLETLIELSQKTGRLSADHREVLLSFVQLFDNKEGGHAISARQMVSVLAQLEGLLGNASTDARLMSFLLQDSLEESPLIQP